jgi:predicted nucleic acid-binding protein
MEIKSIVIDANSYSAFKRGDFDAVEIIRHVPNIIMSPVVMGELLSGFAFGSKEEKNRKELELFLSSERVKLVAIDRNTSEQYTKIYKELRLKGKPIPTNDLWIAATAVQYGNAVFTYDDHFKHISTLKVISTFDDLML